MADSAVADAGFHPRENYSVSEADQMREVDEQVVVAMDPWVASWVGSGISFE